MYISFSYEGKLEEQGLCKHFASDKLRPNYFFWHAGTSKQRWKGKTSARCRNSNKCVGMPVGVCVCEWVKVCESGGDREGGSFKEIVETVTVDSRKGGRRCLQPD